jgi:hypothetical protein
MSDQHEGGSLSHGSNKLSEYQIALETEMQEFRELFIYEQNTAVVNVKVEGELD